MSGKDQFQIAYQALNDEQKEAVDTIEGPVMVVAGPGTGKTQILTLRIANILRLTDTSPDAILALTFTEAAARGMRDRLRQYIGADAYKVSIFTFHGFAEYIISTNQEAFARIIGGTVATDVERFEYIQTILAGDSWRVLRPKGKPDHYVTGILGQISTCKREYVTPDTVATWLNSLEDSLEQEEQYHQSGAHKGKVRRAYLDLEKKILKHQEFVAVYRQYESLLTNHGRYDFDDLILELVAALKTNESLLRQLQEQYHYILADEHQDVNESQNQIVQRLADYHDQPNVFVVGDEKQAIYRFQGASLSNFLYFSDHFTNTKTISLVKNYRSGQSILDSAQAIIETEDERLQALRLPLVSATDTKARVSLRTFTHTATETRWVVEAVEKALADGVSPEEVAIIVRSNRSVEMFAAQLRSFGIPANASAEGAINQHPIVLSLRMLLRTVTDPTDEVALAAVLHAPYWGLSNSDLVRVLSARSRKRRLLDIITDETQYDALGVSDVVPLRAVCAVLSLVREEAATLPPHRLLERILHQSGWLSHIHQYDPLEGARVVRRFYDVVAQAVERQTVNSLADIVQFLALHEQYNIPLQAPYIRQETNAANVLTAHKAKGLEYDVVIVPELTDNAWGGSRTRNTFAIPLTRTSDPEQDTVFADDQRLLYVAMTRARKELHLSYARTSNEGRERLPSRLLEPLISHAGLIDMPDVSDFESDLSPTDTFGSVDTRLIVEPTIIRDIFASRGLSPTSYNNYRRDPWTFLYRNILRVPEFPSLSMQFGTAMHTVWERAVKSWCDTGEVPEVSVLTGYLARALEQLPITAHEYTQLHEQGLQTLPQYRENVLNHLVNVHDVKTEQHIRCVLTVSDGELAEVPLNGALDRIDYDAEGNIIRVVDYKTGQAKSRNAILGQTASSDGDYYVQLCFYALLLQLRGEHHGNIAYTVSFLEPGQQGVVKEEVFTIDNKEIAELTERLQQTVCEITSGVFLDTPCDPEQCSYCDWLSLRL